MSDFFEAEVPCEVSVKRAEELIGTLTTASERKPDGTQSGVVPEILFVLRNWVKIMSTMPHSEGDAEKHNLPFEDMHSAALNFFQKLKAKSDEIEAAYIKVRDLKNDLRELLGEGRRCYDGYKVDDEKDIEKGIHELSNDDLSKMVGSIHADLGALRGESRMELIAKLVIEEASKRLVQKKDSCCD